ncbi:MULTISPECIES: helix-turn-helix transcriptional regulator [unclassified Ensifer]|uniref:helix-turn-helix transcriptional regulator n=1 Tax=unclassified Ensifer TaxID=2633371 RepID=UPI0007129C7A|nr:MULTISPECIES: LuxR family transcriptional regulator [unclassified Ensifer]KQX52482.1 hypothetical protein ASD49_29775 [Ensifer sp. Root1298]KQX85634.1 hypothetical protein ASD41_29640 [Ensifer sp. Root1312]KRC21520.1 hypothetical protein ASE29_30460 [Ensifer sp. Root74]KRD60814.1 hypothetical protein ASE71_32815 [Ensifer sp. Root954]
MNSALDQLIDASNVAMNEEDIREALCAFTKRCAFDWFAYVDMTFPFGAAFTNFPEAWQDEYSACGYLQIDPVMAQAQRLMRPFAWLNAPTPGADRNVRLFWEGAGRHGIGGGVSIPIRCPFGNFAALTFAARDWPHTKSPLDEFKAITAVAFVHARIVACRPTTLKAPDVNLSAREVECLAWASLGKSMAMTAELVGMRPGTVKFHLDRARMKLGAYNLTNAVYQATRQRLI